MIPDEQKEFEQLRRIAEAAKRYLAGHTGFARQELVEALREYDLNVRVKL